MPRANVFHTRGARSEPWQLAAAALLVGIAASVVAVFLRGGVHFLFEQSIAIREHWWGMLLLPAFGAMLGVIVIRVLFREPGGHGVPAVLEAVTRKGGHMRRRSVVSRLIGTLSNVSAGGSAGLEGPIVFSAAAVGSSLADVMRMAERQRVLLLACGVAGGIGAIFNAPLTGMIFAMEVVLAEWTLGALLPIAISATVATEFTRLVFSVPEPLRAASSDVGNAYDLLAFGVLGLIAGLLSVLLVVCIFRTEVITRKWKTGFATANLGVIAGLAGLGVGAIGIFMPEAIGEGYGTIANILQGHTEFGFTLLLLLIAKLLATTLTLGSNSPGGIFAPSLVLGAILGYGFGGLLAYMFPSLSFASPSFFAVAAMAGLVAGSMQAPFTGIMLALESTNSWEGTLPLITVAVLSVLVSRTFLRHSFYTWELAERGELMRPGSDRRILSEMKVGEMLDDDFISICSGSTLDDLVRELPNTSRNQFAVVNESGKYIGMLSVTSLRGVIFDEMVRRVTPVDTIMDASVPTLVSDSTLLSATELFEECGAWVLPVVDEDGLFLGTVSKSMLFDRYRSELIVQTADHLE
ncbi:MAG: chloride channel protein [Planctomycetota bacterium]|jgi:CIC family chloride channel protein|nr:chloride channel protein [Planctomycetota bacterium]